MNVNDEIVNEIPSEESCSNVNNAEPYEGNAEIVEVAVLEIHPESVPARASVREYISRTEGEQILENWINSGQHVDELNKMLDELHIAYSDDCPAKTLQRYLEICTDLPLKFNLLITLIKRRHSSPDEHMHKGIELLRKYKITFFDQLIHHLE